ncbi:MAG TPA: hypothetical protein VI461_03000 [Chitinophagaceae bacterium]|nr:hypothetical protein [Chitinophagaceae bacterium]
MAVALFFIIPVFTFACDIFVNVDGVKKEKYAAGDIVVIRIEVRLTHRNCPVDINETGINISGMQIIGATKWVNTEGSNKWERKIKVKISSEKDGKAMVVAERTCQKDGGKGSLILAT